MRKLIVTTVIAALLSGPAFAACEGDVQPPVCGPVPQTSWSPFAPVTVTPDELNAQQEANAAWRERAYHEAVANRRSGNLSVEYAAQDWNGSVGGGRNPNPYGGQVGASIGGSD